MRTVHGGGPVAPTTSAERRPARQNRWSHVERLAGEPYPHPDLIPHFRRVVDAYGAERILWADHTQAVKPALPPHPAPYSHSPHQLRDSGAFSAAEKEWMLGRTIRTILGWKA